MPCDRNIEQHQGEVEVDLRPLQEGEGRGHGWGIGNLLISTF